MHSLSASEWKFAVDVRSELYGSTQGPISNDTDKSQEHGIRIGYSRTGDGIQTVAMGMCTGGGHGMEWRRW